MSSAVRRTLAVIAARGGSKGVPQRNLIDLCGQPFLAWSIPRAKNAKGVTESDRLKQDPAAVEAMLEREVALRRLGQPHEIADLVAFLASARAAFTTGSVLVADCG